MKSHIIKKPTVPVSKSTRSRLEEERTVGHVALRPEVLRALRRRSLGIHPRPAVIQLQLRTRTEAYGHSEQLTDLRAFSVMLQCFGTARHS